MQLPGAKQHAPTFGTGQGLGEQDDPGPFQMALPVQVVCSTSPHSPDAKQQAPVVDAVQVTWLHKSPSDHLPFFVAQEP